MQNPGSISLSERGGDPVCRWRNCLLLTAYCSLLTASGKEDFKP